MRPVRLQVTIDQSLFFTESTSSETATLEFEWRSRSGLDAFRIQYWQNTLDRGYLLVVAVGYIILGMAFDVIQERYT